MTPWTIACQAPLSLGIIQARILEWVAMPSSRGSSQPRDRTQVCHIAGRILYRLSYKGSPRRLEWVAYSFSRGSSQFQKLNRDLLHCRWILHQLSYQGSPLAFLFSSKIEFSNCTWISKLCPLVFSPCFVKVDSYNSFIKYLAQFIKNSTLAIIFSFIISLSF